MHHSAKLILLRGNSGSGKTTVAKALQRRFGRGTMLLSQDVVRREMLYEKDGPETPAQPLLLELARYGKRHCEVVILEGILNAQWYATLFARLQEEFGQAIYAYYLDIPFEETLKRHAQKPNCLEFGEREMRRWWNEKDFLSGIRETCIEETMSVEETVARIYCDVLASKRL